MKAGFRTPSIAHLMSQNREVYVAPEDVPKLPTRIKAQVFDKEIYVFLTTDASTCFHCHMAGHFTKNCPRKHETTYNLPLSQSQADEIQPISLVHRL